MTALNKTSFKRFASLIRGGLTDHNINVKLRKSYDLLSHTLVGKEWTALSPALPKYFDLPGDNELERMYGWLTTHNKHLSLDLCSSILNTAFQKTSLNWNFLDDLNDLKKKRLLSLRETTNTGKQKKLQS